MQGASRARWWLGMSVTTITPAEFEKAVARACLREANRWLSLNPFVKGDESAVRYGAHLRWIADEAGLSVPQARRRMKVLQDEGRAMRSDTDGGSTRWWLAGLAETQQPAAMATPAAPVRQTLTTPAAPAARQHWSDVLGVPRDCSTSEARTAFSAAIAGLDETDTDYPNHRRRVHDAIDACCREHEIQIQE
jgi:hypothetical protein